MMLAVPKSDILQAIMVSYGNREEIKEFLGENLWQISVTSTGEIDIRFKCRRRFIERSSCDFQEASTGDIIVKFTTGEFMALKSWMFNALFDYHFIPDKQPEELENSNDREIPKETGQS